MLGKSGSSNEGEVVGLAAVRLQTCRLGLELIGDDRSGIGRPE
jgi:hypothetical protein